MTGWCEVLYLLPLLIAPTLHAVEGPAEAARELARRMAVGFRGPVSLTVRNVSDVGPAEVAELRRVLESELRIRGASLVEAAVADELHVTLSRNFAGYLVIAEVKRGEERQVILFPWTRSASMVRAGPPAISVEKTLITSQSEPILDVAKIDSGLLLLEPSGVTRLVAVNGNWEPRESAAFPSFVLPRDPRGRLLVQSGAYLAYLPGVICSGAAEPLDIRCREAEEAWPLGHDPALRANLTHEKNYFDGRVTVPGTSKTVPPFYAAAQVSGPQWIFTQLDGRAWLHDAALEPVAPLGAWGSDIASVAATCGPGSLLLATRPADGSEKDFIRVYRIVERQVAETASAIEMPGPVTALWPIDDNSVVAVARDLASGEYAAYRLAITCSR